MTTAHSAMSDAGFLNAKRPDTTGFALGGTFSRYRAYRSTLAALRALTDRELEDIGFRRDQLKAVARAAVN